MTSRAGKRSQAWARSRVAMVGQQNSYNVETQMCEHEHQGGVDAAGILGLGLFEKSAGRSTGEYRCEDQQAGEEPTSERTQWRPSMADIPNSD